jgi:hypothetical protein
LSRHQGEVTIIGTRIVVGGRGEHRVADIQRLSGRSDEDRAIVGQDGANRANQHESHRRTGVNAARDRSDV